MIKEPNTLCGATPFLPPPRMANYSVFPASASFVSDKTSRRVYCAISWHVCHYVYLSGSCNSLPETRFQSFLLRYLFRGSKIALLPPSRLRHPLPLTNTTAVWCELRRKDAPSLVLSFSFKPITANPFRGYFLFTAYSCKKISLLDVALYKRSLHLAPSSLRDAYKFWSGTEHAN